MFEIREFCDMINVDKPNIFEQMKEAASFQNLEAQNLEDLSEPEL